MSRGWTTVYYLLRFLRKILGIDLLVAEDGVKKIRLECFCFDWSSLRMKRFYEAGAYFETPHSVRTASQEIRDHRPSRR